MGPTDEELLHEFYKGNTAALEQLAARRDPILVRTALLALWARSGSMTHAMYEWDAADQVTAMWSHVLGTPGTFARWPHQRLSALTWLNHVLCIQIDRYLGLHGPF